MDIAFERLAEATAETAARLEAWDNDPAIVHLIRPAKSRAELEERRPADPAKLSARFAAIPSYLIRLDGKPVGVMDYMVDPSYLFRKEAGSAWIGMVVGEASARGRGVGRAALAYLVGEIRAAGLKRAELGVFEFNAPALALYRSAGFAEIGRIPDFTWWDGRLWQDVRMELLFGV